MSHRRLAERVTYMKFTVGAGFRHSTDAMTVAKTRTIMSYCTCMLYSNWVLWVLHRLHRGIRDPSGWQQ